MHLGFCATNECDPMAKDGSRGGHPKDETTRTRDMMFLALLGAWNAPRTIARTSEMFTTPPICQSGNYMCCLTTTRIRSILAFV